MNVLKNVKSITYTNYDTFTIEYNQVDNESETTYLAIDTHAHDAFAHWVYESAIYLPTLNILYLSSPRKYKELFCKFFGITKVVYELPLVNTCIKPILHSLNIQTCDQEYKDLVDNLFVKFNFTYEPKYEYVIMPRQTKENYKGNDRKVDLAKIIAYLPDAYILNTDLIEDLHEQIKIVNSGKTIILTDGSPFLVNGMFINDRNIIVIQNFTIEQASSYPKIKYIIDKISKKNRITYFYNEDHYLQSIS